MGIKFMTKLQVIRHTQKNGIESTRWTDVELTCFLSYDGRFTIKSFVSIARELLRCLRFISMIVVWISLNCSACFHTETTVRDSTYPLESVGSGSLKSRQLRQSVEFFKKL